MQHAKEPANHALYTADGKSFSDLRFKILSICHSYQRHTTFQTQLLTSRLPVLLDPWPHHIVLP